FRRPPIVQVPVLVKESPIVIKGVGNFVGDDRANSPVILATCLFQRIEWRLQDSSWENNDVLKRVVVSVDRGGAHFPAHPVNRLVPTAKHILASNDTQLVKVSNQ